MKNTLVDLQNHIFMRIEALDDNDLVGDDLKEEIDRAMAFAELARLAVQNGALMVKAAEVLYGLPVADELPLIPRSPSENPALFVDKKKELIRIPQGKAK
jgi:hypothetical protein